MSFDTFALAAMASELRSVVLNGRVQRVVQINSLTYGFEIYVHPIRHYLILSVEPQAPRLHLTEKKVRRGTGNDTPLMLVLRKYMRGAILTAIEQPPYERILNFHFDSYHTGPTTLAAEMLGTRSNLVLIAPDTMILGVARLPKINQRNIRILLPNNLYQPPPPQNKRTPAELNEFGLRQELDEASPQLELARLLPNILVGISPLLAREITYRATGDVSTTVDQITSLTPILNSLGELFDRLKTDSWQPTLAFDEDGFVKTFAAYPLRHLAHTEPAESMSAVVESYFAKAAAGYTAAKAPLAEAIANARQKLDRRRERLEEDAEAQADPTLLKDKGEAILANTYQLEPGQESLTVDWPGRNAPLKIALDPLLSASANAQNYFNRYRKAQRASEEIPNQLDKIALEERYLEQLEQDLEMADDRPEIDAVALALSDAGYYRARASRKKQQKRASTRYLRLTAPDGARIWAGKNALQNAYLTFTRASAEDIWLHARGVPGSHVIIPTAEGLPSEEDVFWAASVAAYYSRARYDTSVEVDVTIKKYVRAIKGATPGLVTYRNETTLRVAPEEPEEE
ncbi:MAG: NFACT family protein [Anaerolineae bacterium]|nr:NFACT family protein [Anaerolineae bacterium]